jgi:hypothetical protein
MSRLTTLLSAIGTLSATVALATLAQAQTPSDEDIARRAIERNAVETVVWGMPAVNTELVI